MPSRSPAVQIARPDPRELPHPRDDAAPALSFSVRIPLRLIGLALGLVVLLAFLSLASWSVDDPSFSLATNKATQNWLGFFGSAQADLLLQFFGLAAPVFLLVPAIWAYRLIQRNNPGRWISRIIFWLGAVTLSAAALSFVSMPQSWPLPTGLGGLVGHIFNSLVATLSGATAEGWGAALFAALFTPPALGLVWLSARSAKQDQMDPTMAEHMADDDPEQSGFFDVLFGGTFHLAMSARAAWGRAWARTKEKWDARRAAEQTDWSEPVPTAGSPVHAPSAPTSTIRREPLMVPEATTPRHGDRAEPRFDADDNADWAEDDADEATMAYDTDDAVDAFDGTDEDDVPFDAFEDAAARMSVESNARPAPRRPAVEPRFDDEPTQRRVAAPTSVKPGKRVVREAQGSLLDTDGFELPELSLLTDPPASAVAEEHLPHNLEAQARKLEAVLADFGVKGDIINVRPGPVVTLYELEPAPGIKSSRVISLADDIARSMSAVSARVAVVPGRNAIGIELPNKNRETVFLREMLASSDFERMKGKLPMCLGKTIGGEPIIADLARMPHLLIAGTTGSGKSVAVNTMILSLLYRMSPEECRLIMIDPKMLELSIYDGIPHLLTPVVTDPSKAVTALKWAVREMEDRYRKMSKIGVRNIDGFNKRVAEAKARGEIITRTVQTGFDRDTGEAVYESETFDLDPLPFIVVIVDEMADLMMVAGKDIEGAIQRLAQMARAAGIHLIMATQRPSVDVITGTIKANFPTRISFQVTSKIDSRTILGEQGAEQLLGMGDMLYMAGGGRIKRLHGPFVDDGEVEAVVRHLKDQGAPDYLETITQEDDEGAMAGEYDPSSGEFGGSGDELYDKAVNIVLNDRKASTSYIQRRLSIGYNRAATLIERMEQEGVISPANHAGKREVLVGDGVD